MFACFLISIKAMGDSSSDDLGEVDVVNVFRYGQEGLSGVRVSSFKSLNILYSLTLLWRLHYSRVVRHSDRFMVI
jgi:hypothetical protein